MGLGLNFFESTLCGMGHCGQMYSLSKIMQAQIRQTPNLIPTLSTTLGNVGTVVDVASFNCSDIFSTGSIDSVSPESQNSQRKEFVER